MNVLRLRSRTIARTRIVHRQHSPTIARRTIVRRQRNPTIVRRQISRTIVRTIIIRTIIVPRITVRRRIVPQRQHRIGRLRLSHPGLRRIVLPSHPRATTVRPRSPTIVPNPIVRKPLVRPRVRLSPTGINPLRVRKRLPRPSARSSGRLLLLRPNRRRQPSARNQNRKRPRRKSASRISRSRRGNECQSVKSDENGAEHPEFSQGVFVACLRCRTRELKAG